MSFVCAPAYCNDEKALCQYVMALFYVCILAINFMFLIVSLVNSHVVLRCQVK